LTNLRWGEIAAISGTVEVLQVKGYTVLQVKGYTVLQVKGYTVLQVKGYTYGFDREDGHLTFVFEADGRPVYLCPHVRDVAPKAFLARMEGLP